MKKIFKRAAATALVIGLVAGGMNYSTSTAEAISLGGVGKIIGVGGGGGADMNSANERMVETFSYSTALLQAAYENVQLATNDSIANKELITQEQAAKSAVKSTDGGIKMKNGAEQNKQEADNAKKYLADALASGDEEKLKKIDAFIKTANDQRLVSDVMAHVAYTQAGLIIAQNAKNVASGNLQGLGDMVDTAKQVQDLLKVRNELSTLLKTATEEYRKARGIKDPSKKEQKAAADKIEKG